MSVRERRGERRRRCRMRCTGTNSRGEPCGSHARTGTDYCNAHSDRKLKEEIGFGGPQPGSGRPRKPTPDELWLMAFLAEHEQWFQVLVDAREATDTQFFGPKGEQFAEVVPDHKTRLAAFREIADRLFGRPKQQTEISGPEGGPIVTEGSLDLTRLTDEELEQLRQLQRKARP